MGGSDMAAEYRNLKLDSCSEFGGLEEKMGVQKITVSDHINEFHCPAGKTDSFLIDMESSSLSSNKDVHPNSTTTRNLPRKAFQRGGSGVASSSPKALVGSAMPDNATTVGVGTTDNFSKSQTHHEISIAGNNIKPTAENKMSIRRNSFRSPSA